MLLGFSERNLSISLALWVLLFCKAPLVPVVLDNKKQRICPYPSSALSKILLVLLSRMIPLPISLPYMELKPGVPTLLERPEVRHDV